MFEIHTANNGNPYLKWVDKRKMSSDRGHWVEIGKHDEKEIQRLVEINTNNGLIVLMDENGIYRALVLTE